MNQPTSQTSSGDVTIKIIGAIILIFGIWTLVTSIRTALGLGILGQVITFHNPETVKRYSGLLLFIYSPIFLLYLLTSLLSVIFGITLLVNKWVRAAGVFLIITPIVYYVVSIWSTLAATNGLANGIRLYVPNIMEIIMVIAGVIVLRKSKNTSVLA